MGGAERSVHDAEEPSAVPAGVPTAHRRARAEGAYARRTRTPVRTLGPGDSKLGSAGRPSCRALISPVTGIAMAISPSGGRPSSARCSARPLITLATLRIHSIRAFASSVLDVVQDRGRRGRSPPLSGPLRALAGWNGLPALPSWPRGGAIHADHHAPVSSHAEIGKTSRYRLTCVRDPLCASTMAPVTPSNPWASSPGNRVGPGAP